MTAPTTAAIAAPGRLFVGGFTENQARVVVRALNDLIAVGVEIGATFTHRRRLPLVEGRAPALEKLVERLVDMGYDGAIAATYQRAARGAAEKVRARLREARNQ